MVFKMLHMILTFFMFFFSFLLNIVFFFIFIFTCIHFIKAMLGLEKFLNLIFFLQNLNYWFLISRKKYLKEKFWSIKEKQARAKTWARKHEGWLSTFKGFYIPPQLPQTEQGKFFQKKREQDEQEQRDKAFEELAWKKKKIIQKNLPLNLDTEEVAFSEIQQALAGGDHINIPEIFEENEFTYEKNPEHSYQMQHLTSSTSSSSIDPISKKNSQKILNTEKLFSKIKFSKKFLWIPFPRLFNFTSNYYTWSFLNIGFNTSEFLSFFFIKAFPPFLVNFNFLKTKILLVKKLKFYLSPRMFLLESFLLEPNVLHFYTLIKNVNFLNVTTFNNVFFITSIFQSWKTRFFSFLFFKNLVFSFLFHLHPKINTSNLKKNLVVTFFWHLFSLVKTALNFNNNLEIFGFLNEILLTRYAGIFTMQTTLVPTWKKKLLDISFSVSELTEYKFYFFKFCNFFFTKPHYSNFAQYNISIDCSPYIPSSLFLEEFLLNFNFLSETTGFLEKPLFCHVYENLFISGINLSKHMYETQTFIPKTFLVFFKNRVRQYEATRLFFYNSFAHQVYMLWDINVARILFWYIIRKGKKLTARRVFFKFLKKFKKNYNLPPLAIFSHAMLLVEPHIWIKKKKIAGKLYEIPIYISPSWSKRIAIRWILQAAKKWKWASITDSLAQEVWDACFWWGGAFANKELVQATVKRNKAYLRWL